jgi:hypothetical protein
MNLPDGLSGKRAKWRILGKRPENGMNMLSLLGMALSTSTAHSSRMEGVGACMAVSREQRDGTIQDLARRQTGRSEALGRTGV